LALPASHGENDGRFGYPNSVQKSPSSSPPYQTLEVEDGRRAAGCSYVTLFIPREIGVDA